MARLTRFHEMQQGHIRSVCHALCYHLIQRRGVTLLLTSMQAGINTPRTGHPLRLLLKNKTCLVHRCEYYGKIHLQLSASFLHIHGQWQVVILLCSASQVFVFRQREKTIIISPQKSRITSEELMHCHIYWERVATLCAWPFQTIFPDCVKLKSFSMMNHFVNGWWGWGGEVGEKGIKLHLETKALTSGT